MQPKDLSYLKKASAASLDKDTTKKMAKCLEDLTTTGSTTLNEANLKRFKKFCRKSDDYVRYSFMLIMDQLQRKHSEIRLSAFQVAAEIFTRSHAFREILIVHLQEFLTLTIGIETGKPLPPPKPAANQLKETTIRTVQKWYDEYGKSYRKLDYGYNYLKNCKHIDFRNIIARNEAERLKAEQEKERKEKQMADRLAKVLTVITENKPEIEDCVKEAENCLKLLLPTPENFQLFTKEDAVDTNTSKIKSNQSKSKGASSSSTNSKPELDDNAYNKNKGTEDYGTCDLKDSNENNNENSLGESIEVGHGDLSSTANGSGWDTSQKDESIESKTKQAGNAPDNSFIEHDADNDDEIASEDEDEYAYSSDEMENDRAHGFGNAGVSINIEIPVEDNVAVKETEDNTDVLQSLKDAAKLINTIFLPRVTKWLEVMGKNGAGQRDIKSIIDLKLSLESIKSKCTELKMVFADKPGDNDSDDDDDFEDVPEKEGFEATVLPPVDDIRDDGPSSSNSIVEKSPLKRHRSSETPSSDSQSQLSSMKKAKSFTHWNLKERQKDDSLSDPTSFASALARIQSSDTTSEDIKPSTSSAIQPSTSKEGTSKPDVPFVEFGTEMAHWENIDDIEAPEIVKLDSLHRFWTAHENESEGTKKEHVQLMLNRAYKFTGEFEPVKWSCRAPLKNGKLCPRMDRVKCPFHGRIIPRDEAGNPSIKEEPGASTSTTSNASQNANDEEYSELPPWRDPELQREIEQTTGHDLGSARSQKLLDKATNKGKGKGKKKNGLTDIKAASNTSRNRLEKIVFNKRAMRRVCSTMDTADYKRVRDKFGNQFNYSGQ